MITVKLMGGMGNQMFQYAVGRALSLKHGVGLRLDVSFLLDRTPRKNFTYRDYDLPIFDLYADLPDPRVTNNSGIAHLLKRVLRRDYYVAERGFEFQPRVLDSPSECYLEGYWQNEKYFKAVEETIRADFHIRLPLTPRAMEISDAIRSTESVCVNVRRGDFVSNPEANRFHGVCSLEYFAQGVEFVSERTANPHLYFFSDDPVWCRENMKFDVPVTLVDHECAGEKFSSYLTLMSQCRHFVIPNSSFGWWGAWLSRSPDKIVVVPEVWMAGIGYLSRNCVPPDWHILPNCVSSQK